MNNDDLSHFEICKPGFYAAVCVELEIDNLAIAALLQVRVYIPNVFFLLYKQ